MTTANTDEIHIPIACNLSQPDQAARGQEIEDNLFSGCTSVQELDNGYAFIFPGEDTWATRLLTFIQEERKCCPFFTFEIVFEPESGPLHLHLRGGEGVKPFVKENFVDVLMGSRLHT